MTPFGSLTFGDVLGRIESSVTNLRGAGQDKIAEALQKLTEAVFVTAEFRGTQEQIVDQISELAVQAVRHTEERKPGVLKAVWDGLNSVLGSSANVATIWGQWGPVIKEFFGI